MLAQQTMPASHAGEDQASAQLAARADHWENLAAQLLIAAKVMAHEYLQEECDDVRACVDSAHHQAVRNFCEAVKNADRAGLSDACAVLVALVATKPQQLWSVDDEFTAGTLSDLIKANDWLRPGDYVYTAQTTGRYKLTEADVAAAVAANAPARDPRVADLFATGGAA